MGNYLHDKFHRRINYLRLSVTDRCNFRCQYCMPDTGMEDRDHGEVLSYEELLLIAQAAVSLGVEKIRITGGEPLLRPGIIDFLKKLKKLPGLNYLALTTNGYALSEYAGRLSEIGMTSLNVSLDSLEDMTFRRVTRQGHLTPVIQGLVQAYLRGIPLKINVVVIQGVNDHEILNFAALANYYDLTVRFIEYMPSSAKAPINGIGAQEIYERIVGRYSLQKLDSSEHSGPSQDYRIVGGRGRIGIISAMSCPFCSSCNRIRVTSTGEMKNCLFSDEETDLKPYLADHDLPGLRDAILNNVFNKPEKHGVFCSGGQNPALQMARVGG